MTAITPPVFIFIALLMIVLSELDLEVRYHGVLSVTFHIYILAIELTAKNEKRTSKKQKKKIDKKSDPLLKVKKTLAYLKVLFEIIESSEITIEKLSFPQLYIFPPLERYKENALIASTISVLIAYLATKALKLNQSPNANLNGADSFAVDITVKTRVFHIIYALIILKRRLKTAGA